MKIKPSSDNRKIRNIFSFDEAYGKNIENNTNNSHDDDDDDNVYNNNKSNEENINIYKKNNMENLEYEFEIRRLKREFDMLKKENNKIKENIQNVKNENTNLENVIFKSGDQEEILNNLILLNKQYILYGSPNGIETDFNNKNGNDSFDNLILNIMDIKYYYENNLLINEFFEGINKLLGTIPIENNGNNDDNDDDDANLIKKINELIDIKNNLDNNNNKYKYFLEKNNNYYFYYKNLLNNLNLNNFEELEEFIKNLYIKNLKDKDNMKKIQNTLMSDSSPVNKSKGKKGHYYSSSVITNNINKNVFNINNYTKLQNYLSIRNNDSKQKQKKISNYIDSKRKRDLEQYLSRTDNFYQNNFLNLKNNQEDGTKDYFQSFYNKNNTYLNNNNISCNNERKKRRKIKMNYLYSDKEVNKKFYNGADNVYSKYKNKTENKNYLVKNTVT